MCHLILFCMLSIVNQDTNSLYLCVIGFTVLFPAINVFQNESHAIYLYLFVSPLLNAKAEIIIYTQYVAWRYLTKSYDNINESRTELSE